MRARDFSDGFAEPILWGARHAFSVVEIAEGLGLPVATVMAVIESRSPVRFPAGGVRAIDTTRTDPAYLAWARAHTGAAAALAGGAP